MSPQLSPTNNIRPSDQVIPRPHERGSHGYTRISIALFAAGLTTFSAMYAVQGLLPVLATYFHASPAKTALTVSLTTGMLALAIIPASILSERFGRVRVMTWSAMISAVIGIVLPLAPSLDYLLIGRAAQGITLAGVPAVAMAYLAEEIHSGSLGAAMGRYVAGTTLGGLLGRIVTTVAVDIVNWRWALEVSSVVALIFTLIFVKLAPQSQLFTPKPLRVRDEARSLIDHLANPALLAMFTLAFLLMGGFVSVYNYLGFRLTAAPFNFPTYIVGFVFTLYLAGTFSSVKAGSWADRYGRPRTLSISLAVTAAGLALTVANNVVVIIIGVLLFTAGFFAAHSTASGWVGRVAHRNRAEASALYLFAYYAGSSILGGLSGISFASWGWNGVASFVGSLLITAGIATGLLVLYLRRAR